MLCKICNNQSVENWIVFTNKEEKKQLAIDFIRAFIIFKLVHKNIFICHIYSYFKDFQSYVYVA